MSIVTEKEESASKRRIGRGRHGLNLDKTGQLAIGVKVSQFSNTQNIKE